MRIVSNITPISELFKIDRLELLRLVYGYLLIPEAVAHELRGAQTWPGLKRLDRLYIGTAYISERLYREASCQLRR
jgi:predicted nucleic acid-binding protein